MRLVRLLPDRWQKLLHEAAKFGVVGGINTVINYVVFNALALTIFADGQLKATVIATIVATITSYLMNRHWTYRDRPKSAMRREYALFFLFNATGLAIELGVLALAKYGLGFHGLIALNIAKTIGVLLATAFRFWSYRTFVFRPVPAAAATSSPDDTAVEGAPATAGTVKSTAGTVNSADTGPPAEATAGTGTAENTEAGTADPEPATPPATVNAATVNTATANSGPANTNTSPAPQAGTEHPTTATEIPHTDFRRLTAPLERELATPIDVDLEAEFAAELDAASRRPASR